MILTGGTQQKNQIRGLEQLGKWLTFPGEVLQQSLMTPGISLSPTYIFHVSGLMTDSSRCPDGCYSSSPHMLTTVRGRRGTSISRDSFENRGELYQK